MVKGYWILFFLICISSEHYCSMQYDFHTAKYASLEKDNYEVLELLLNGTHLGQDTYKFCPNNKDNKSGEDFLLELAAPVNSLKARNSTCKCNELSKGSSNVEQPDACHGKSAGILLQKISAHMIKREAEKNVNKVIDSFVTTAKQVSGKIQFPDFDYPYNGAVIQIRDGWIIGVESLERSSPVAILKNETTYILSFEVSFPVVQFGYNKVKILTHKWLGENEHLHISVRARNGKLNVTLIVRVVTEEECRLTIKDTKMTYLESTDLTIDGPDYLTWILPSLKSSISRFSYGIYMKIISRYVQMIMQEASKTFLFKVTGLY